MKFTRREFVWMSMGLFAAGCASTTPRSSSSALPPPVWPPDAGVHPSTHTLITSNNDGVVSSPASYPKANQPPTKAAALPNGPPALMAIPRTAWAEADPISAKLNPMEGVARITVHHEGWTPVWFTDYAATAVRLEQIRKSHLVRLGAADIGYHYVIDRGGRVWQGREVKYQGAHVRNNNEHNVGVMVLGNFDVQTPSEVQLATLETTLKTLMLHYKVKCSPFGTPKGGVHDPASQKEDRYVYTHREINPTECPGTSLQAHMMALRSANGALRQV